MREVVRKGVILLFVCLGFVVRAYSMNISNTIDLEEYEDRLVRATVKIVIEDEDEPELFDIIEQEAAKPRTDFIDNIIRLNRDFSEFDRARARAIFRATYRYRSEPKNFHDLYVESYIECLKECIRQ